MRAFTAVAAFVALAGACGGASAPSPATPPPDPARLERAMNDVAAGRGSLEALVDPRRGLVSILWQLDASDEDPRAGADGVIRVAERRCGDALREEVRALDADLRRRAEASGDAIFACDARGCRHAALMEYDVEGAYSFAPSDPPRLEQVVRIEGGLSDAGRAEAQRWIDRELARLSAGECPTR